MIMLCNLQIVLGSNLYTSAGFSDVSNMFLNIPFNFTQNVKCKTSTISEMYISCQIWLIFIYHTPHPHLMVKEES